MTHKKTEIFLTTFDKHQLGHDIHVYSDTVTVQDLLEALAHFAQEYLSDCRGCDGCCHERAPLTAPDMLALAELLPPSPYPIQGVCEAFAHISVDKAGIVDIALRRGPDGACIFLNQQGKYCQNWQARPFVCRSHFCLPRSPRLEALRGEIANRGENELIRLLLAEEQQGAPALLPPTLQGEDFPLDPAFTGPSWEQIYIKEIVSPELWQELKELS